MRLVKQSILYFKEGNSDKVYEIDLCDVGDSKYVVNFRYGRKGSNLKEGSKTPVPVSLADAEKIFQSVEAEKVSKGYTTSPDGSPSKPATKVTFNTEVALNLDWMTQISGKIKAILERLHHAVQGTTPTTRSSWKLSRVIWKAGEYKIKEAAPYIIKLFNKGDTLHQYVCTWALVRCANKSLVPFFKQIYTTHSSKLVTKIAGVGLHFNADEEAEKQHTKQYFDSLPEALKEPFELKKQAEFYALLQEQSSYEFLENLYLLSFDYEWVRPLVFQLLQTLPFKPGYFKQIRSIYKLSELLDDFELEGMLATRFERERPFFISHIAQKDTKRRIFFHSLNESINPTIELRKQNSRLAYSQRSRWYFVRRIRRRLEMLGDNDNPEYVKLATNILISYKRNLDFKEAYSRQKYSWNGRRNVIIETRYPQNAQAVFLHQLLSGEHPQLVLEDNRIWRLASEAEMLADSSGAKKKEGGGFLKKLAALFGKKKEAAPVEAPPANENGTPYLHLWNQHPHAYIKLLEQAEMEEIHEFAIGGLTTHPKYAELKANMHKEDCKRLLRSRFPLPAEFGFNIVSEKYNMAQPEADLVAAMLNSINEQARNKGRQLAEANQAAYFADEEFIFNLVLSVQAETVSWMKPLLRNASMSTDTKKIVIGKTVWTMVAIIESNEQRDKMIDNAADTLVEFFAPELQQVPVELIAQLLQHPVPAVLVFGLRLLKAQKDIIQPDSLNRSLLFALLQHPDARVRAEGVSLLSEISVDLLLTYQDDILAGTLSPHQNVRQGLFASIDKMAQKDKAFGKKAAEALMPYLWHKETSEGIHADISHLLCNELSDHLQDANKETALKLLYSNYAAAQNVGVIVLEKYTDPAQLTIPQIIALGNHENLNVRTWSWKFYSEQVPRIKYEKEAAIKLLESKWEDTRNFAKQFFRDQFGENDWSPEALITLADSVKPDIEAYGRELITRFFDNAQGVQYLLKLSQHPGEKMQLFATNYLERFAADDVEKIQSLEFYFRSVLTRVNKSRIAKNRIYHFLLTQGRKSEEAAKIVGAILSDVSAIAAIGDKAKCIEILLQLKSLYAVETPLQVRDIETR